MIYRCWDYHIVGLLFLKRNAKVVGDATVGDCPASSSRIQQLSAGQSFGHNLPHPYLPIPGQAGEDRMAEVGTNGLQDDRLGLLTGQTRSAGVTAARHLQSSKKGYHGTSQAALRFKVCIDNCTNSHLPSYET